MIYYNMRYRGPYEYDKFTLNILNYVNYVYDYIYDWTTKPSFVPMAPAGMLYTQQRSNDQLKKTACDIISDSSKTKRVRRVKMSQWIASSDKPSLPKISCYSVKH